MKKEYVTKLAELKAKAVRTPAEEALMTAIIDLEAKEKVVPFNKEVIDEAVEVVEDAEDKV